MRFTFATVFGVLIACSTVGLSQTFPDYPPLISIEYEDLDQAALIILNQLPDLNQPEALEFFCPDDPVYTYKLEVANQIGNNEICQGASQEADCGLVELHRDNCQSSKIQLGTNYNADWVWVSSIMSRGCIEHNPADDMILEITPNGSIQTVSEVIITGVRPHWFGGTNYLLNKLEYFEFEIIGQDGDVIPQSDPYIQAPPTPGLPVLDYTFHLDNPITINPSGGPLTIRIKQCGGLPAANTFGYANLFGWINVSVTGNCGCGVCGTPYWQVGSTNNLECDVPHPIPMQILDECGQVIVNCPVMAVVVSCPATNEPCLTCTCPENDDLFIIVGTDTLYSHDTLYLSGCLDLIPSPADFLQLPPGVGQMLSTDYYNQNGIRVIRWKWWGGGCPDLYFRLFVIYDENCNGYCPSPGDLYIITSMGDTLYSKDTLYLSGCLDLIPSPADFLQLPPGVGQMLSIDSYMGGIRVIRWKWWGGGCPDLYFKLYVVYDEDCSMFCPDQDDLFIIVAGDTLYHQDTLYLPYCLALIPSPTDFLQHGPGVGQILSIDSIDMNGVRTIRWKWWGGNCPDLYFRIYIIYGDPDCEQEPPGNMALQGIHGPMNPENIRAEALFNSNESNTFSWDVSPNPANESLQIRMQGLPDIPVLISVFDLQGRRLFETQLSGAGEILTIPINDFPEGLLLVRLQTGQDSQTKKILVRH
ncbi:MAG: T9SS type A sorting domain-containing protein [Saprospiraceae bacterium]|nr:T9SS type A sorting domain-containing protein [Saprospiraceae bacterium]